ncbi:MAG: hypothetical protein A4E28_01132 [Methanocella sp. PtaU1.Bin125]|nr:MAG: hypothetical protein A4E28_01132 [Methanocella sp. PtaU1.Bin125]
MRALVAVYTRTFNSFKVASRIKETIGADLTRIELAGGEQSNISNGILTFLGQKAPIKPCKTDLRSYDLLVLCCPVWSKSTPPAVNQYLSEIQHGEGRKCAIAVTYDGDGADRAIGKITKLMSARGLYCIDSMSVMAAQVGDGSYYDLVTQFASGLNTKAMVPVAVRKTADTTGKAVKTAGNAAKTAGAVGRFFLRR